MVGTGSVAAAFHLPALARSREAVVAGVADLDPVARTRASRAARAPAYATLDQMLASVALDAVVVAVPSRWHAEVAASAACAGLHVYVEKPVATEAEDARHMLRAVQAAGVVAVAGLNRRLHPLYRRGRALVAAGRIGPLVTAQLTYSEPTPPGRMPEWKRRRSSGGGVLLDLASHHLDLLTWLTGEQIVAVSAAGASTLTEQDGAWLRARLSGGAVALGAYSFRGGFADVIELIGERGTLTLDRHGGSMRLRLARRVLYGARAGWTRPAADLLAWRLSHAVLRHADPSYRATLDAFVAQARGGPAVAPDLTAGIRSLEAVLAAERSAREGGVEVEVSPVSS